MPFIACITDLNGGEILDEMENSRKRRYYKLQVLLVYKKEHMMVDDATFVRLCSGARSLARKSIFTQKNPTSLI